MDDGAIQGPFKTAIDAADAYSCSLSCQLPDDDNDCSGAVGFTSRIESEGRKVISRRTANAIFAIVSGYEGVLKHRGDVAEFDWAEVIPGVFFIDPMKDDVGAELKALNISKENGDEEAIAAAQAKLKKLMRKQKYFDFTFDNSSRLFKSPNESYVIKIPMEGRGKLAKFPAEWVRFCLPSSTGSRIKVKVGLLHMHWNQVSNLISTGLEIGAK
jgi:hypothetical protein